jgi:thioredoxin reductase
MADGGNGGWGRFVATQRPRPLVLSTDPADVAVVGGGPAGLAAALWAARYRRRVFLVDGGRQRNRWTDSTHGYLGLEAAAPAAILDRARADLGRYPEIEAVHQVDIDEVTPLGEQGFALRLGDDRNVQALRVVLATGVRDVFPDIHGFESFYGRSLFTCPSCDGYEVQGKAVAVVGEGDHIASFALSLLDWASSVAVVVDAHAATDHGAHRDRLTASRVHLVVGEPDAFLGSDGELHGLRLKDGRTIDCQKAFCTLRHVQHSDLPRRLGCAVTDEGCVIVDDHCRTSVEHVYAAGDMTPGPHLVQVAAAKGATAGIAAALSLRGTAGAPRSPRPAPDPDEVLAK